jgi:hypothetical protein
VMKRVLVDGRRLELPTSALRTSGGNGPIWLSVRDVKDASSRNSSDAEIRVFAPVSAWSCTPVVHNWPQISAAGHREVAACGDRDPVARQPWWAVSVALTANLDDGTLIS